MTTREIEIACMVHAGVEPVVMCNNPQSHMLNNGHRCIGNSCAQFDGKRCEYHDPIYPTGADGIPLLKEKLLKGNNLERLVFSYWQKSPKVSCVLYYQSGQGNVVACGHAHGEGDTEQAAFYAAFYAAFVKET